MALSKRTIETVKNLVQVEEVVGDFVTLKRRGTNLIANCPFHHEKSPSFYVSPSKGIYKCFGCGKAGDGITFVMEHEQLSYPDAIRWLARRYNIPVEEEVDLNDEEKAANSERETLFIIMAWAARYFAEQLWQSDQGKALAYSYLKERGLIDRTITEWELGYSHDGWDTLLKAGVAAGHNPELMEKAGLLLRKDNGDYFDRFRNRVMFPITNAMGRVIAFGARLLGNDKSQAKYLNSPETPIYHKSDVLFGLSQAKKEIKRIDQVLLTEGYMDVIALSQAGFGYAVASSGTSLTQEQTKLIGRHTKNIVVLYDGDKAGVAASLRGIDIILAQGLDVRACMLPGGDDPDSYIKRQGVQAFEEELSKNTKDFITFKASVLLAEAGTDPVKRANGIRDIVRSISLVPDTIKRSLFYSQCSSMFGIEEANLIAEGNKLVRSRLDEEHKEQQRNAYAQRRAAAQGGTGDVAPPTFDEYEGELDLPADLLPTDLDHARLRIDDLKRLQNQHENDGIRLLLSYGDHMLSGQEYLSLYFKKQIENQVEFVNPLNERIFEIFKEHLDQDLFPTVDFFLHHEDLVLQQHVINLMTERYLTSPGWAEKNIRIPKEEDLLDSLINNNVLWMQYNVVAMLLEETHAALRHTTDETEVEELLTNFQTIKKVEMSLAAKLGFVVPPL